MITTHLLPAPKDEWPALTTRRGASATLGIVSSNPRPTLTLEIDRREPISGRLRDGEGTNEEFVGWLGLASALERVLGLATTPESRDRPAHRADLAS